MNVLLSIKPKYVNEILAGKKKFEFRKAIFKKKDISKVFIYSSSPVKRVVASFEISKIIEDTPKKLWRQCHKYGGIKKQDFFDYFKDSDVAYAIEITNLNKLSEPIDPYALMTDFKAPQSYCYLPLDRFEKIMGSNISKKTFQDTKLLETTETYASDSNLKSASSKKKSSKSVTEGGLDKPLNLLE